MKILVVTTQVPFVYGGAEILAEGLVAELSKKDCDVELVKIPFQWQPSERILDSMLACRLLDCSHFNGQKVDLVIGLKFPAYLVSHPHKVLWLLHQHRQAYELWGTKYNDMIQSPNALQLRQSIHHSDIQALSECHKRYTISKNVSKRTEQFNQIDSIPLYHPPKNEDEFYCIDSQNYLFFPSRLTSIKRQFIVLEALKKTKNPVKVIFAGKADNSDYMNYLNILSKDLKLSERAIFLGQVTEEEKLKYYAESLAVVYCPYDEDYGYVTLESMLSSKAVLTCSDSGGSTEFIEDRKTGLIVEPTPESIALAMDDLWENRSWTQKMGQEGKSKYREMNISWDNVITRLLEI
jgi:glycosyltransferase involved in cell wall biosynthesis